MTKFFAICVFRKKWENKGGITRTILIIASQKIFKIFQMWDHNFFENFKIFGCYVTILSIRTSILGNFVKSRSVRSEFVDLRKNNSHCNCRSLHF